MNITLANKVLNFLESEGISQIILCAGARNSPFIYLLENTKRFHVLHFFEERSASFFALGSALKNAKPTAIITTSGTAAAELLPATIEAYYSNIPIVLITADRPSEFRGTGAPQSIEQVGIFSHYTKTSDIQNLDFNFAQLQWDQKSALHLNVCFAEPLIDEPLPIEVTNNQKINAISVKSKSTDELHNFKNNWDFFIQKCKSPLVIIGGLSDSEQITVHDFLKQYDGPVYIESLSGLKNSSHVSKSILSGERFLKKCFDSHLFDGVIRIGSIPTTRIWRDLEDQLKSLPVLTISNQIWKGLSRDSQLINDYSFLNFILNASSSKESALNFSWDARIHLLDRFYRQQIQKLLESYPTSEQGMIYNYSKLVNDQPLYLGNSLPIREWDIYSSIAKDKPFLQTVAGNRGANGIDGQISTYLGWSQNIKKSFSLFGDLTALYDLSSLWITAQINPDTIKNIVIMNNHGGLIFEKMFKKEIFLNRHNIDFKNWAQMWNWYYINWKSIPPHHEFEQSAIIELTPDLNETEKFNQDLEQLWKKEF